MKLVPTVASLLSIGAAAPHPTPATRPPAPDTRYPRPHQSPSYEVYAIRYAVLPHYPVAGLVAGADTTRYIDVPLLIWLSRGQGRVVLVDAGCYREKFVERWRLRDYVKPSLAIAPLGIKPEEVTDIIVSHPHWDHVDGVDLFPKARVWMQREEWQYYSDSSRAKGAPGVDSVDLVMLKEIERSGRLRLAPGDAQEIIPGITVYTGGRHTWQSQYAAVRSGGATVVLASDNLYLYENLDRGRPIAATFDSVSNLRAHQRMVSLASERKYVIPGHDPEILTRFPAVAPGIVRIH